MNETERDRVTRRKINKKNRSNQRMKRERAKKTYPLYLYTSFRNWVRSNLHITESLVFIIHLLISTHGSVRTHTHHFSIRFVLQTVEFCVSLCSSRLTALIIKWIKFSAYEKRIKDVIWKKAAHKSSPHALHIRMKGGERERELMRVLNYGPQLFCVNGKLTRIRIYGPILVTHFFGAPSSIRTNYRKTTRSKNKTNKSVWSVELQELWSSE